MAAGENPAPAHAGAPEGLPELTVEDVQGMYPWLDIWEGYAGSFYASPKPEGPWPLTGATPGELNKAIITAQERMRGRWPLDASSEPGP